MVNMMMTGMARCGNGADFERATGRIVFVFQILTRFFRDRCDSAPQLCMSSPKIRLADAINLVGSMRC
jgi:hypothetical protein